MITARSTLAVLAAGVVTAALLAQSGQPESRSPRRDRDRSLIAQANTFQTDVPAHPFNVILVNPTPTSMTASVLVHADAEVMIEYGDAPAGSKATPILSQRIPARMLKARDPQSFELLPLKPDSMYAYRVRWRSTGQERPAAEWSSSDVYTFRTPPKPGGGRPFEPMTFTVQADSHLDANMTPAVYARALENARADAAAFHIDLGDTFMTDKRQDFHDALPQYLAQRYYFGTLCSSAPLFMVLGNHDGESGIAIARRGGGGGGGRGDRGEDTKAGIAAWSYAQRTNFFPPPVIASSGPAAMYTGRTSMTGNTGANYYTFTWGDVRIIALDPYWFTTQRMRGGGEIETTLTDDSWVWTLGREQYSWLKSTLESSTSKYTFVCIHHLVGGRGKATRGGVESAPYFEWGGKNADGSNGFAARRPAAEGWSEPIHTLLAKHGVTAVLHGHDHLYVHAALDGVTNQCVPQPGNARSNTRAAADYGYQTGTILPSPGHLRVRVDAGQAVVTYVRASTGSDNGRVIDEYALRPRERTPRSSAR